MKVRIALVILATMASFATAPASAAKAAPDGGNSSFIVQMSDAPAVSYKGGIPGLKATKPRNGQKIDPLDPAVINYAAYLASRHDRALNAVGGGQKLYGYYYSFNGFAATLTAEQALKMSTQPGVLAVSPNELREMDTSSTPTFLGLNAPGGLWDQLGGTAKAGDGIIIGVVDSGIWPENLAFSDRTGTNGNATQDGKLSFKQIPGWHGKCTPGEGFNASMCNQKLIGAQRFNASWGGDAGVEAQRPWEFTSPRDYNGHGTHTTSTAGGNFGVPVTGPAAAFGTINGMAPHARVAMYKALWSTQNASTASGFTADLVAAIDQAVADGVDVINYSISGTSTNFRDPVEISFLFAADAGVFVAASAGNSGPTSSTVAHPSPWITTVAAGTHSRSLLANLTLGNTAVYTGASSATSSVTGPMINSTAAGLFGADANAVKLCFSASWNGGTPVLDPALVTGRIVVCERGTSDRVDKSRAVFEAGGIGMVLVNTSVTTLNPDSHSVPTVHLAVTDRVAVQTYAGTVGATGTISQAFIDLTTPAPFTASFSSRGPLQAGGGDLLKPDVIAPGQDIFAAVAPPGNGGQSFALYSGTSMSSPHVAGLAALLKHRHPDWTPMMIKSALMTTAYDVLDGGTPPAAETNPVLIFRQGAGHVRPNSAVDPGLVFDSGVNDWLNFICGTQPGSFCSAYTPIDPSNLNVASIAIGDLAGAQTVTRTVKNVGSTTATYTFSKTGLAGFTAVASPADFTLGKGDSQTITFTFTRTTATLNAYTGGQFRWTDGTHNVRIPVVLRPILFAAPTQVSGSYNVSFGYTGAFTATARGLIAPVTNAGSVSTSSFVDFPVVIPAGTTYARFSLFDDSVSKPSDLDLQLRNAASTSALASTGGATSNEEINWVSPTAGSYTLRVIGFDTGDDPTSFTQFNWFLDSADAGNMTVTGPPSATLGTTGMINLVFSGLSPATKYLGSVAYAGTSGLPNPTIVRVDTAPAP